MSQNNQNRFAAMSPSAGAGQNQKRKNSGNKNKVDEEGNEPLLDNSAPEESKLIHDNADRAFQA